MHDTAWLRDGGRVRPQDNPKTVFLSRHLAFSPFVAFFSSSHQLEYPRKPIVDPCRTFWVQQPLFTMPSPEEMFAPYEASATGRRPYRHLDPARSPFPLNRRVDPRFKKVPHPRLSDDARDLSALRLR